MVNLDQCPCAGGTLSKLIQPGILTVLAERPLHGYRLVRQLARFQTLGGSKPDATGVYRALKAMQKRGLVTSKWDLSEPGPAKHLYRLTRLGKICLTRWVRTLRDYREALGELLGLVERASGSCRCRTSGRVRNPIPKRSRRVCRVKA
jgi:DNA-binding PadR family transcriptional regulator